MGIRLRGRAMELQDDMVGILLNGCRPCTHHITTAAKSSAPLCPLPLPHARSSAARRRQWQTHSRSLTNSFEGQGSNTENVRCGCDWYRPLDVSVPTASPRPQRCTLFRLPSPV